MNDYTSDIIDLTDPDCEIFRKNLKETSNGYICSRNVHEICINESAVYLIACEDPV